jgi:hypothetical protein
MGIDEHAGLVRQPRRLSRAVVSNDKRFSRRTIAKRFAVMKRAKRVVCIAVAVLLASCVGVKTDITVKRDLSGTARLEYTVSQNFLTGGTLDGNERWPTVPVGKADFEQTVSRIDGLTLRSYRERETGGDHVFEITLAFDHVSALAEFLGANGQQFDYTNEDGRHVFTVVFNKAASGETAQPHDKELSALTKKVFEGYRFDFTISVPGGKESYSAPMGDLLTSAQPEGLVIGFR